MTESAAQPSLDREIPDRLDDMRAAAVRGDSKEVDIQRSMVRLWLLDAQDCAWTRTVEASLRQSLEAYCMLHPRSACGIA